MSEWKKEGVKVSYSGLVGLIVIYTLCKRHSSFFRFYSHLYVEANSNRKFPGLCNCYNIDWGSSLHPDLGICNILLFLLGLSPSNRDGITAGRNRIILFRSFSILIKIVLLCQKKASYTGPVDFKDTLGITLTIEQGLEKISVVFHFLISIFHGINSPLTDFTIIYGAEHVWEYGRTLLCWHYY